MLVLLLFGTFELRFYLIMSFVHDFDWLFPPELNNALKPRNTPASLPVTADRRSPSPTATPAPLAAPIGPGSKPGTVKAIVSQRYNNPLGLYSNENQTVQLEGQAKFLVDETPG